jgi:hypothetical protein
MRPLIIAAAIAGFGTAAHAAAGDVSNGGGDAVPIPAPVPSVPATARKQAEATVAQAVSDHGPVTFRAIHALEAKAIRRDAFAQPVDGPVSVVCGQFNQVDRPSGAGYEWFLVAIKRGQVLWTTYDTPGAYTEAYYSCKAAGLTDATAHTGEFR